MRHVTGLAALLALSACSSVLDSRNQSIAVETIPPAAHCIVLRSGARVGEIATTPAIITLPRSPLNLVFVCDKPGYQQGSSVNGAGVSDGAVASAVLLGGTGWAIDTLGGKANSYRERVTLTLAALPDPQAPPDTHQADRAP